MNMATLIGILSTLLPIAGLFGFYVLVLCSIPAKRDVQRQSLLAMVFAISMVFTLLHPQEVLPGVILDARGAILAMAYLLGGPLVALVTMLLGMLTRLYLGGVGAWAGVAGLLLNFAGCLVLGVYLGRVWKDPDSNAYPLLLACWAAISEMLSLFMIPPLSLGLQIFSESGLILGLAQLSCFALMWAMVFLYRRQVQIEQTMQSERRHFVEDMQQQHQRFDVMFEQAAVGIAIVSPVGELLQVNSKLAEILLRPRAELEKMTFQQITWPEDLESDLSLVDQLLRGDLKTYRLEKRYIRGDGELVWSNLTVSLVRTSTGKPDYFVSFIEDITEQKTYQQQISKMAFRDALTDLPNRRLFLDRLRYAMARSRRSEQFGALLMIDLDSFKTLNDTQGHAAGDSFLKDVAHRLRQNILPQDTVARLGGDEFVVILENLGDQETLAAAKAEELAETLRGVIGQPFYKDAGMAGMPFQTTASIGICLFSGREESLEDLLKHADLALYGAKEAGRNSLKFYSAEMQYALEMRSIIQSALFLALENHQLQIYAQAQVDKEGGVVGAELLLRWQHPKVGWISPAQFIPLAEETGAIVPIGRWVLLEACRTLARWARLQGYEGLSLAINVSICQFSQDSFVDEVKDALAQTGAPPRALKLEFTESIVIDNIDDTVAKMKQLQALGIRFSMDDFGTGYSSLSCLKRLPLDQLKIDQSFIRDITADPDDAAIVKAILSMCQSLELEVIAEGVETVQQQYFLQQHGCLLYQGYLFGRPMPLAELERLHRLSLIG